MAVRRVVFERKGTKAKLGSTVIDRHGLTELLARQTRDNALFLSAAAQNDVADVQARLCSGSVPAFCSGEPIVSTRTTSPGVSLPVTAR